MPGSKYGRCNSLETGGSVTAGGVLGLSIYDEGAV